MKALIVYESMFGNTAKVAHAVADGLGVHMAVELVQAGKAPAPLTDPVDLVVVGGPTHAFSMSRASTRAVAIPIGILAARSDAFERWSRPVLDAMQTMPAFVYLVPVIALFNVGRVPGIVAGVVYALPPCIRLTDLGIRGVPRNTTEAAKAYGATSWQLLRKVEIPSALPLVFTGLRVSARLHLPALGLTNQLEAVLQGLSRHGGRTQLYTSRGTGFWGPPLRVFAPSSALASAVRPVCASTAARW